MRLRGLVGAVAAVIALAGAASTASAQDEQPRKLPLTIFEAPAPVVPPDAAGREALREPPPRPDRLSDAIKATVVISDPRCVPGEDEFLRGEPRLPGRRSRPR